MAANTPVIIESLKLRTQAQVFYAKSAEASAKAVSGEAYDLSWYEKGLNLLKSGGNLVNLTIANAESMGKNLAKVGAQTEAFAKEGDKLTNAAIENDKKLKKGLAKPPDFAGNAKATSDALAEINKAYEEARLTLLGEQAKELEQVKIKYDGLIAKAKKFGKDTTLLEEAREKENATIRDKFAKQEADKAEKAAKDTLDKKQKAYDEQFALDEQKLNLRVAKGEITENEYQTKLFELRKNAAIQNEALTNDALSKEQENLNNKRLVDLSNLQLALQNETITKEQFDAKKLEIEQTYQTNVDTAAAAALQKNKDFIAAQVDLEKYRTDEKKKSAEEERNILANRIQSQIEALDTENARIEGDFEQDLERLAQKRELLKEQEINDLANTELTEFQKTEIRKKYADARKNVSDQEIATEKAAAEAKNEINMAYLGLFEQFGNTLSSLAGKNKALAIAGIVVSQAAAIGQIIAQTSIANAKAVAANPLAFGQPWVTINTISAGLSIASTIASAAKSIAQINQSAGSSSGSSGGSTGNVSAAPPPVPKAAGTTAPQIQTAGGQNPTTAIAETIGAAQKPLKAYVVSGEISSQQALDRRTSRAATFSGG